MQLKHRVEETHFSLHANKASVPLADYHLFQVISLTFFMPDHMKGMFHHYNVLLTEWPNCLAFPYSGCLPGSNLIFINLDGLCRFFFSCRNKGKTFIQFETYPGFQSEANTSLKYPGWFNSIRIFLLSNVPPQPFLSH